MSLKLLPGLFTVDARDYNDTSTLQFLNPLWISGIPKIKPLSEVTVSGFYNTTAFYGGFIASYKPLASGTTIPEWQ